MRKINSEWVRGGIVLVAALVVVFGIYGLFSVVLPLAPHPIVNDVEPEAANEVPPPDPVYKLASLPRLEPGRMLEFGLGKDNHPLPGNAALISGWSVPEANGIWSLGKNAVIGFTVQCKIAGCHSDDALLHFDGAIFSAPDQPSQTIVFWVNGKKVDQVNLGLPQARFTVELKGVVMQEGTPVLLTLHVPNPVALARLTASRDTRDVAFRIGSLSLEL